MPKLPSNLQEGAEEAAQSSGSFEPLDPGIYTARLGKCEAGQTRGGEGKQVKPMWKLEFDQIYDLEGNKAPGRLWSNITIEESVQWKIGQFFGAFGVPTSTDTDMMVNHRLRLEVSQRVQTVGKNTGKTVNEVDRYSVLVEGDLGYEKGQKLIQLLTPKKAAAKAAPAKAAAKAAAPKVEEIEDEIPDDEAIAADAAAEEEGDEF